MSSSALQVLYGLGLDNPPDARWGEVARPFQRDDAKAILEPARGAPRMHWVGRPKGSSKTTDIAAILIAWLVAQAREHEVAYTFSGDFDQSNRLLQRARIIISRTPALKTALKVEARRIVALRTQASAEALPADASGNEGLLSPFIVCEELSNWPETTNAERTLTVALSTVPKLPGGRLVIIGHAGSPSHFSFKLLQQAKSSPRWRVVELPGPTPWVDPADLEEQRLLLLPSEFDRRWLNRWTAGEDRLTNPEDLRACVTLLGPQSYREGTTYVMTVDLGITNDRTVVTVMHRDGQRIVLDQMQVWQGTRFRPVSLTAVESWIRATHLEYGRPLVRLDPHQAIQMMENLTRAGVRAEKFDFGAQSVGRLGLALYRCIREHNLAIFDDEELIKELLGVRLRESSPGVYRLDHVSGQHDDRAIALALGVEYLAAKPNPAPASMAGAVLMSQTNLLEDAFRWRP